MQTSAALEKEKATFAHEESDTEYDRIPRQLSLDPMVQKESDGIVDKKKISNVVCFFNPVSCFGGRQIRSRLDGLPFLRYQSYGWLRMRSFTPIMRLNTASTGIRYLFVELYPSESLEITT